MGFASKRRYISSMKKEAQKGKNYRIQTSIKDSLKVNWDKFKQKKKGK